MAISSNKKTVIFYLIDGARPDVLQKLANQGQLPNISTELMERGSYTKGVTCFPSTTGPAYLPLLTGYYPGDHNITGIRWFDKSVYLAKNRWARNAMRSYCGYEAKYFNQDMDPEKPSLFEEYQRGFNIYNMITKGVPEENDVTKKGKAKLYYRAHFYHEHHPVDKAGHRQLMNCLEKDPQFIFAVFPSVDWDAHTYHYEDHQTIEAYKIADNSLGEVVQRLKDMGRYEDTLIIMASDHGLSATHTHLDLGTYFRHKGYRVLEYPKIWAFRPNLAVFISGNSFASLSFLDHEGPYYTKKLKDRHGQVLDQFVQEKAIDFIIYRENEAGYRIQNKSGEAIIKIADEKLSYHPESADPLSLGLLEKPMDRQSSFDATFDSSYPDALFQIHQLMRSSRAGDVVISAAPGYDLRDFWEIPEHKGSHGSLHWEHMHVPILTNKKNLISKPVSTSYIHQTIKDWLGQPH